MSGWEAGTRTPIDRSRVPPPTFHINNINHLGWHNAEKFGKIRKKAARRKKGEISSCGIPRKIRCPEELPVKCRVGGAILNRNREGSRPDVWAIGGKRVTVIL